MDKKPSIKTETIKSVFLKAVFPALIFLTFLKTVSPSFIDLDPIISSPILSAAIAIILLTLGYLGFNQIKSEFAKSNLQEHNTYLDFAICILFFLFLIFAIDVWIEKTPQTNSSLIFAIIFLIILIFGIILKCCTKPLFVTTLKRRFAPEASNDDDLNFSESARKAATAIKNEKKYVSVVALNGGYGEGKSSYARMIIEAIGAEKSLYSYISLTETNATNDFSKLFAKRWFEALNERYPTINIAPHVASLEEILRESTNHSALVSTISQILVKLNFGLNKTVAKFWDLNALKKEEGKKIFVPNSTAAMFNYIPEIKEDVWIINIDEIERAQLDEIYRVIEVIERFKHEGRFGLPVKLVFLLCVSGSDLQKRLENLKGFGNEKAQLIEDFFFNNPKSRDQNLFLPPIPQEVKEQFTRDLLNKILVKFHLTESTEPESTPVGEINEFIGDEDKSLTWVINTLSRESPRMIVKVCQELEFFYHCFRGLDGKSAAAELATCDSLCISFIKMKYPDLIEVFKFNELTLSYLYLKTKSAPERLQEIIDKAFDDEEVKKMLLKQVDQLINLVGIVSYKICKLSSEENPLDGIYADLRTSNRQTMLDVLNLHLSSRNSATSRKTYESENHKSAVSNLLNKDLLTYSYDLAKTTEASWSKNFDVAQELFERLKIGTAENKIILIPTELSSDSDYNNASYRFLFAISYAIEKVINFKKEGEAEREEALKKIWDCIKKFLESDKIAIDPKYIFLSGFANKSGISLTRMRLTGLFEDIVRITNGSSERDKLIKTVFEDAKKRYFVGDKSVYENEENFAHVLFQSWNGRKDSPENYQIIREAAARDLKKYPKAIDYYWKIALERLNDKLFSASKEFEMFAPEQLRKITEDAIKLTNDQSLKDKLQSHLNHYQVITKSKIIRPEALIENSQNTSKPLMMAMIDQGYIDESVSFFAD